MIQRLRKSVGFLIGLTVIAQLVSFVRESIFAYYYGTSYQADAYVMASQIPIALFAVVTTSINTVILPIYTEKMEKGDKQRADKFLNSFIVIFEGICVVLATVSCIFARQIVFVFAPAFSGELLNLTIRYVRLLFPTIILSSIINILTVRFNVFKKFAYPQCVGFFQNIAIIISMVLFARNINTDAAVAGTIAGLFLNALFLVVPCHEVFKEKIEVAALWSEIKKVLVKVIPVACGVGIAEVNRIIDKAIASGLDTGSITGLNYANKLAVVFSALVVTALSTVCFQKFSSLYAKEEYLKCYEELLNYTEVLVYILLPITCGAMILKKELITAAFARGAFGVDSVSLTSDIFFYYSIGILPIAIREILSKYYYSAGDTKTPMINSAIGVVINIVLNLILSRFMGASGLALATTVSYIVVCLLLFISIVRAQKNRNIKKRFIAIIPCIIASLIMSITIALLLKNSEFNSIINFLVGLCIGMVVYFSICFLIARKQLYHVLETLFGKV